MAEWVRPMIVILCTLVMLYTNLFGDGGSGFTGDSSDPGMYYAYPTSFSPAPFTFAIWLPIFFGCCALAVYQALPSQIANPRLDAFALPYCCALLANASTPFLRIGWSNLVVTLLFLLLCIATCVVTRGNVHSVQETWAIRIPLVAFTTWCGLASLVNLCQFLVSRGFIISSTLTISLVCLAMGLGVIAMYCTKEPVIAVVMLWAGIGILCSQPSWNAISFSVAITSAVTLLATLWVVLASSDIAAQK
jgi:hypothetical protein